jgi:hypothetical protein
VLGEFFVADEADIDDALIEEGPYGRFTTVEAKTVSSVSIATLGEILGAGTYEALLDRVEGPQATSGEAGLDAVPPEMRDALAAADDLDSAADAWGASEEMAEWERDEVREVVGELAKLARQAREANQQLWFWWSL